MRSLARAAVLVVLLGWTSTVVRAADRYVTPLGIDNSNDCATRTSPCRSINHAIAQAASGDVVDLAAGMYHEGVRLQVEAATVTLSFLGGWDATFTQRDPVHTPSVIRSAVTDVPPFIGKDRTWVVSAGDAAVLNVTMNGIVLTGGRGTISPPSFAPTVLYRAGGGLLVFSYEDSNVTFAFANGAITKNRALDTAGGALIYAGDGGTIDATITNTSITRNRSGALGGGLYAAANPYPPGSAPSVQLRVVGSVIAKNRAEYWAGGALFESGSPVAGASLTVDLVGTTISANVAKTPSSLTPGSYFPGGGGIACDANQPLAIRLVDSIVWGNKATGLGADDIYQIDLANGPAVTFDADHSDLGDVVLSGATWNDLGGNLDVKPGFERFPHLSPASPLVDAGTCAGVPATDGDGDPRPSGAACDIGADEVP